MAVIQLESNEQFEKALTEDSVLIWFSAPWCSPCRQVSPAVEEISETRKVVKVNIDDFPELATKYVVMTIPTLIDFKDGEPTVKSVGVKAKAALLRDFSV